jgi:hypothetical protein
MAALTVARGASDLNGDAELAELIIGALLAKAYDPINLFCSICLQIERTLVITVDWHAMDKRRSLQQFTHAPF